MGNHERVIGIGWPVTQAYGGSAYGMYMDASMPRYSRTKWEQIVRDYSEKYAVLSQWQQKNIETVHNNGGWLQIPSGRIFRFARLDKAGWDGLWYPATAIKNYPSQGFATADVMPLAMTMVRKKMREQGCKSLVMLQVHDSLVSDLVSSEVDLVADIHVGVFRNLPKYLHDFFGLDFDLPLDGEYEVGPNYGSMQRIR